MTKLEKRIQRELDFRIDRKNWVVSFEPTGLCFREKRKRTSYPLSWGEIWMAAMEAAVAKRKREKAEKRKAKAKAKAKAIARKAAS